MVALDLALAVNDITPLPMSAIRLQKLRDSVRRDGYGDPKFFARSLDDVVREDNIRGDMLLDRFDELCRIFARDNPGKPLDDATLQALDREALLYVDLKLANKSEMKKRAMEALERTLKLGQVGEEEFEGEDSRKPRRIRKKKKRVIVSEAEENGESGASSTESSSSSSSSSSEDEEDGKE